MSEFDSFPEPNRSMQVPRTEIPQQCLLSCAEEIAQASTAQDFLGWISVCAYGIPHSEADPQDIAQMTALKALEYEKNIHNIEGFLRITARHIIIDIARRKRASEGTSEIENSIKFAVGDIANEVVDRAFGAFESSRLYRAFGKLSLADQRVLELRYFSNMSVAETSAIMGIATGSVSPFTRKALKRLKAIMQTETDA